MAKRNLSTYLLIGVPLAFVALLIFAVASNRVPSQFDGFAQCLADKEAKMYGAWWCPHCTAQKALFGNAFKFVNYVECSPNQTRTMSEQCKTEGVKSFPTWRFADGTELVGEQPLAVLGQKTGCELPK